MASAVCNTYQTPMQTTVGMWRALLSLAYGDSRIVCPAYARVGKSFASPTSSHASALLLIDDERPLAGTCECQPCSKKLAGTYVAQLAAVALALLLPAHRVMGRAKAPALKGARHMMGDRNSGSNSGFVLPNQSRPVVSR